MSSPRRSRRLAGLPPVETKTPMKIVYPEPPVRVAGMCEKVFVGVYAVTSTFVLLNRVRTAVALLL